MPHASCRMPRGRKGGGVAEIIMPKMGDAMTEGKVVRWYKKAGDAVKKGEPVAEIETDKVNLDLEAEADGTLGELAAKEGEVVQVGGLLAQIVLRRDRKNLRLVAAVLEHGLQHALQAPVQAAEEDRGGVTLRAREGARRVRAVVLSGDRSHCVLRRGDSSTLREAAR